MRHPREMSASEVQQFLQMLANERRVSVSTHNQDLECAAVSVRRGADGPLCGSCVGIRFGSTCAGGDLGEQSFGPSLLRAPASWYDRDRYYRPLPAFGKCRPRVV